MSNRLRIDYLGTRMGLAASAFAVEHQARGHEVSHRHDLSQVSVTTPPDVVVHHPLDRTAGGLVGSCGLAGLLPGHVLLVPMFGDLGPSHQMFLLHALKGNCHPKMLLHWMGSERRTPCRLLDEVETAVNGPSAISFTGLFPLPLDVRKTDVGEVMASRERFGRLLYAAASYRDWATWGDLTRILRLGDGVVRNVNGELGNVLKEAGIVPRDDRWTAQCFTRFAVEYRSFIVSYGQYHLNYDPPVNPIWWCSQLDQEAS